MTLVASSLAQDFQGVHAILESTSARRKAGFWKLYQLLAVNALLFS